MKTILPIIVILLIFGCSQQKKKSGNNDMDEKYYTEKFRPQYHFSPDSMWMNDPNGMVYYEGEYHLFYQYYPDSNVWGPMHWGHAVSPDMVHWEHLPIALYPDEYGYIFSGSAVVDEKNTSGLGEDGKAPLVAIFTYHDPVGAAKGELDYQNQGLAYSNDKGRIWTKYGEPVLKNPGIKDFRDPKVSWREEFGKWIMTLAVQDHVEFYSSPNLIDWEKTGEYGREIGAHGGVWECPDLFPIKIDGSDEIHWILLVSINPGGPHGGSATQYFIGDFDGNTFTSLQTEIKWLDQGSDNYAGVTWSGIPDSDGRILFLGWMSNWLYAQVVPTERWRSAMTIPRQLKLENVNGELLLTSVPVKELFTLREREVKPQITEVSGNLLVNTEDIPVMRSEMLFDFSLNNVDSEFGIQLSNKNGEKVKIGYSKSEGNIYIDRREAGVSSFSEGFSAVQTAPYKADSSLQLHLYVDEASIEVFVDGGKVVMTDILFPNIPYNKVELFTTKGSIHVTGSKIWGLSSIW